MSGQARVKLDLVVEAVAQDTLGGTARDIPLVLTRPFPPEMRAHVSFALQEVLLGHARRAVSSAKAVTLGQDGLDEFKTMTPESLYFEILRFVTALRDKFNRFDPRLISEQLALLRASENLKLSQDHGQVRQDFTDKHKGKLRLLKAHLLTIFGSQQLASIEYAPVVFQFLATAERHCDSRRVWKTLKDDAVLKGQTISERLKASTAKHYEAVRIKRRAESQKRLGRQAKVKRDMRARKVNSGNSDADSSEDEEQDEEEEAPDSHPGEFYQSDGSSMASSNDDESSAKRPRKEKTYSIL